MMRHLTTWVVAGVLGTLVMTGNAEACHKKRCGCAAPAPCGPVVTCQRPVPPPRPVCQPVVAQSCGHKAKKCRGCGGGGMFAKHGHKKNCGYASCGTPVVYSGYYTANYTYSGPVAPSGQMMATPQK